MFYVKSCVFQLFLLNGYEWMNIVWNTYLVAVKKHELSTSTISNDVTILNRDCQFVIAPPLFLFWTLFVFPFVLFSPLSHCCKASSSKSLKAEWDLNIACKGRPPNEFVMQMHHTVFGINFLLHSVSLVQIILLHTLLIPLIQAHLFHQQHSHRLSLLPSSYLFLVRYVCYAKLTLLKR